MKWAGASYSTVGGIYSEVKAYRALIAAILQTAFSDAGQNSPKGRQAESFVRGHWCEELCDGIGVDVGAYRNRFRLECARKCRKRLGSEITQNRKENTPNSYRSGLERKM